MNRLQAELNRLYRVGNLPTDPEGRVRALVLEVASPPGWRELSNVWRGVQADLEMPAPAIALSGTDGFQLWFSLGQPVPVQRAAAFLEGLRGRYLAGVAEARIRRMPAAGPAAPRMPVHDGTPPRQVAEERWSAFVAPDLAPVFGDEPWLDHPVGDDAQADLLSRLETTGPGCFDTAWAALGCGPGTHPALRPLPLPLAESAASSPAGVSDPRRFLLQVMNDAGVDMALRIEAAKALLPFVEGQGPG